MNTYDAVIIGAGLAGLQCARLLARRGAKILLVDRKTDLTRGIHTTGIFVRKTLEDFEFPADCLGKPVRNVKLYSPKLKALDLESEREEFRVGKMGALYESFLEECLASGAEFSGGTRYAGIEAAGAETIVKLEKNGESFRVGTKVLVGADGAQSKPNRPPRILIIDDDETARYTLGTFAARPGAQLIEAENGLAGIEVARREKPDIILLDLMMPGIGGHEVLERLKDDPATSAIPVVMITSRFINDDERRQILGRATQVVYKGDLSRELVNGVIDEALKG